MQTAYKEGIISREKALKKFQGWLAYTSQSNSYKYKKHITRLFNQCFPFDTPITTTVKKHEKILQTTEENNLEFSTQKTLHLLKKKLSIHQIAERRNIKETTAWNHVAKLIEYHQLSVWDILPKKKTWKILHKIHSEKDKLKDIKERIKDSSITYDEINCALASIKAKNRKKNICHLSKWYQKTHCQRKCYLNKKQRTVCSKKFDHFVSQNPSLEMERKEFLTLFNEHMNICVLPEREKRRYITLKEFNDKIEQQ